MSARAMIGTFLVTAVILTGCANGSAEPTQEAAVLADAAPTASGPAASAQEPSTGAPVFYLDADVGCYSLSPDPTEDSLLEGFDKQIYARNCGQDHNLEVFAASNLDGFDAATNLTQDDAQAECMAAYSDTFGFGPPLEALTPEELQSHPYLYWFFPDDGLEAIKYPGRLICMAIVTDANGDRVLHRTGSLIPDSPAPAPSPTAAAVFYLDAKPGCYAVTVNADESAAVTSMGKELYPRDCDSPHHLEVISSTRVKGFSATKNLTQEQARKRCIANYQDVFAAAPPTELLDDAQQELTPYLYWLYPDDGAEAGDHPGRLICTVMTADSGGERITVHVGALSPAS